MCDTTHTQPQLLAYATKLGLVGKGRNAYGGIKSPSKKKTDLCATINKALGAGVSKRTKTTHAAKEATDALIMKQVERSDTRLFTRESEITGPPPTMQMCVDSACSKKEHCARSMFMRKCHLKGDYLTRFVQLMDIFFDTRTTGTTLLSTDKNTKENLTTIPISDILHDVAMSNYYGLSYEILNEIDIYILKAGYTSQLALLYFVIIAQKKLKQGFDPSALYFIMAQPTPLVEKIGEMRTHHEEMAYDGSISLSGKQKIAVVGGSIAIALAGIALGSHLTGREGALSVKWYQNIFKNIGAYFQGEQPKSSLGAMGKVENLQKDMLARMRELSDGSYTESQLADKAFAELKPAEQLLLQKYVNVAFAAGTNTSPLNPSNPTGQVFHKFLAAKQLPALTPAATPHFAGERTPLSVIDTLDAEAMAEAAVAAQAAAAKAAEAVATATTHATGQKAIKDLSALQEKFENAKEAATAAARAATAAESVALRKLSLTEAQLKYAQGRSTLLLPHGVKLKFNNPSITGGWFGEGGLSVGGAAYLDHRADLA